MSTAQVIINELNSLRSDRDTVKFKLRVLDEKISLLEKLMGSQTAALHESSAGPASVDVKPKVLRPRDSAWSEALIKGVENHPTLELMGIARLVAGDDKAAQQRAYATLYGYSRRGKIVKDGGLWTVK
jgi:hypothetical protein